MQRPAKELEIHKRRHSPRYALDKAISKANALMGQVYSRWEQLKKLYQGLTGEASNETGWLQLARHTTGLWASILSSIQRLDILKDALRNFAQQGLSCDLHLDAQQALGEVASALFDQLKGECQNRQVDLLNRLLQRLQAQVTFYKSPEELQSLKDQMQVYMKAISKAASKKLQSNLPWDIFFQIDAILRACGHTS